MGALVGGATVKGPGEVGTLLYFCHCELVDQFSDRGRIADLIAERKRSSLLLRLNYLFLDVDELVADQADYRLHFERGPDRSGRGWNVYNPSHGGGHFELTRVSRTP